VTSSATPQLNKTALNSVHRRLGARMVDFGGWDMPLEYSGILAEHIAVRTAAGIFDVSHMGELEIRGPRALDLVQHVTCNNAAKLADDQAHYSGLMTSAGTFVDDILVHRFSPKHFLLCMNASNKNRDFAHICANNPFGAEVENSGPRYSQLAIQGPRATAVVQSLSSVELDRIRYYWFTTGEVGGIHCIIARTGYTGEDGFELYCSPDHAERLWHDLLEAGKPEGLIPCGLGARNTLRMEAGMCLYGHEIDDTTTPWEAGLAWICKPDKGDFLGRAALIAQEEQGPTRQLVGFEMRGPRIARDACPVTSNGKIVGKVTSAGPAPFLKKNIGMAYVPPELTNPGTKLEIDIRGKAAPAEVVALPFYKRSK